MRLSVLARSAACALLLAAYAAAEEGVTTTELRIGSCSALTGPAKDQGLHQSAGAEAYFAYINDNGGVYGRKIKFLKYDDEYRPENALECYKKLLKDRVFLTGFFTATAPAVQYAKLAQASKIPMFGVTSGGEFLYQPFKRYVLTVRPSFHDEAQQIIAHLWNDLGVRRMGIIYQEDQYGGAVLGALTEALAQRGAKPVALGSFPRMMPQYDAAIDTVRAAKPQVVVLASLAPSGASIIKLSRAKGWNVRFLNIGARDSLIKLAGADGDGSIDSELFPSSAPLLGLYHRLMKEYGDGIDTNYALEGFVNAVILVEGLKRAGPNPTREGFIDGVESMHDVDIGLGRDDAVHFSATNHKALKTCYYLISRRGEDAVLTDWRALLAPAR